MNVWLHVALGCAIADPLYSVSPISYGRPHPTRTLGSPYRLASTNVPPVIFHATDTICPDMILLGVKEIVQETCFSTSTVVEHTAGCVPVSPCTVKVYVVVLFIVSVAVLLRVG